MNDSTSMIEKGADQLPLRARGGGRAWGSADPFHSNAYMRRATYGSRNATDAATLVVAGPPGPPPPLARSELDRLRRILARDLIQPLVEPPRVRLLSLRQRLEPLRQLRQPLVPRGLGHARVHLGVLVRLAGHRGLQVQLGLA